MAQPHMTCTQCLTSYRTDNLPFPFPITCTNPVPPTCQTCRCVATAHRRWRWQKGRTSVSRAGWTPSPTRNYVSRGSSITPSTPWRLRVTASRWGRDTVSSTTRQGKCPPHVVCCCLLGCSLKGSVYQNMGR